MPHQTNRLYDVWADGRHLIAKEYLSNVDVGAALNEYRALRLVEPMDIAPRPLFYDLSVGPVVVYAYLEGAMWDRRVPATAELVALADLWVALHDLPIEDLWVGRARARNSPIRVARWRAPIERYAAWAAQTGDGARLNAARVCMQALERGLADALPLIPEEAPVCFCRSDARFANVIARPDGRVGLVDWEDSGLRDPALEVADVLHHPNQEDLLDAQGWQPFLDRYLPSRSADAGFSERVRGYTALFPVFWVGVLLPEGMRRAASGALAGWLINDLEANQRLRRYVARGLAWPAIDPTGRLSDVADVGHHPWPTGSGKTSGSRRRTRPDGNTVAPSSRLRLSRLSAASGALAEGQPGQASSDCRPTSTQSA
jgi:aminoglycoside phosphotransferase (APT) family kinase protein